MQNNNNNNNYMFDADTVVTRLSRDDNSFEYAANISANWNIRSHPNGGYLMAVALRAMLASVNAPHPLVLSTFFLRPASPGPARIVVKILRETASYPTAEAVVYQKITPKDKDTTTEVEIYRLTGTFTDLTTAKGPTAIINSEAPPMVDYSDRIVSGDAMKEAFSIAVNLEVGYHPEAYPPVRGDATKFNHGVVTGWVRFKDGRPIDLFSLSLLCDGLFPAAGNMGPKFLWAPTLQFTTHFRRIPAPGPVCVQTKSRVLIDGHVEEKCKIWDSLGNLVATSLQISALRGGDAAKDDRPHHSAVSSLPSNKDAAL